MIYQADDLIGVEMGDFAAVVGKVRGAVGRVRKLVRKVRGKAGKAGAAVAKAAAPAESAPVESLPAARGPAAGVMDFISRNPLPVAGGVLLAVFLLARKRRG